MLAIPPSPTNMNLLKKMTINANINVGNVYHDIVEWNNKTYNTQCWLYPSYISGSKTVDNY